jgi:hypothetical protein
MDGETRTKALAGLQDAIDLVTEELGQFTPRDHGNARTAVALAQQLVALDEARRILSRGGTAEHGGL